MGVVRDLLQNVPLPNFYRVTNHMDDTHIQDPAQAVRDALKREGTLERIRPGSTVCLTAASREIDNIVLIFPQRSRRERIGIREKRQFFRRDNRKNEAPRPATAP